MTSVSLTINRKARVASCEPRTHLADFLRETYNLTGTHLGCEHGVCGACTLLIDGVPARSCITFAVACEGAEITTVEGLDDDEIATELRAAFKQEHGLQCGYCTPGMLVSARDTVMRLDDPGEHEVRVAMSGNLCRCTGYVGITRAIQSVIRDRRARGIGAIPDGSRSRLGPAGSGNAGATAGAVAVPRTNAAAGVAAPSVRQAPASTVRRDEAWQPQTTFEQSFTVDHPVDVVWAFFDDLPAVASCLPGAALTSDPTDGHVEGMMKVKVGPISAEFHGFADITRDNASRSGTIDGMGKDKRNNSATRGRIAYAVGQGADPGRTRVDVTIGFTLTGILAQFSRSGLVQDVANRLIAVFVRNLEARLAHGVQGTPALVAAEFDAGSFTVSLIGGFIKRLFARLLGRGR